MRWLACSWSSIPDTLSRMDGSCACCIDGQGPTFVAIPFVCKKGGKKGQPLCWPPLYLARIGGMASVLLEKGLDGVGGELAVIEALFRAAKQP